MSRDPPRPYRRRARGVGAAWRRGRRMVSVAALTSLLAGALPARAQTVDEWFGVDKALHFSLSAALAGTGYAAAALLTGRPEVRLGVGAGFALSLGIAKEVYDATGAGDASWRDLAWDTLGTGVGIVSAWLIDALVHSLQTPRRSDAR